MVDAIKTRHEMYAKLARRRTRLASAIGEDMRPAFAWPGAFAAVFVVARMLATIAILIIFSMSAMAVREKCGRSGDFALVAVGLAVAAACACCGIADCVYVFSAISRDWSAAKALDHSRYGLSPTAFWLMAFGSSAVGIVMLSVCTAAAALLSTWSVPPAAASEDTVAGDCDPRPQLLLTAIAALYHSALDWACFGAILVDWVWTNNVILAARKTDDFMLDTVFGPIDPDGPNIFAGDMPDRPPPSYTSATPLAIN